MDGVLEQVTRTLSGDAVLAISIESALAALIAAVRWKLAALELILATAKVPVLCGAVDAELGGDLQQAQALNLAAIGQGPEGLLLLVATGPASSSLFLSST